MSKSTRRGASAARSDVPAGAARFTDNYLPYLLAQASALACAAFADDLRTARLSNLAWRIMATLRDDGTLSIGRLSEIVLARQPRVTQVVNGLARDGLVERRNSSADGRVTMVKVSPFGKRRIEALLGVARAREAFARTALGASNLRLLKTLLRRLACDRAA